MGEKEQPNDVDEHIDAYLSAFKEGNLPKAIFHAMKGYIVARETKDNSNAIILLSLAYRALDRVFGQLRETRHSTTQDQRVCSFCSKEVDKEGVLAGPAAYICRECVEKAGRIFFE